MTVTFALHGYEDTNPAEEFGPLQAELERRGFPCRIIRSRRRRTKTPHRDRAQVLIEGLRDVEGDVALVGLSNQGLFLPLVAAARPVRRIVFINAAVPRPGHSFREASRDEQVYSNAITRFLGWLSPGMSEVCPLTELPKAEYVYISGEKDDALRPEWEQWQAREILHVEPVVIKDAGHTDIILDHVSETVDAATRNLGAVEPAKALTSPEPVQPSPQPVVGTGAGIASMVIANLVPLAVYFGLHRSGASDIKALGLAWVLPVAWTIGSSLMRRRLNLPGLLGAFVYGVALFFAVFLGAGALAIKLHKPVVSGIIGLVCIVSVALRRPILVAIVRRAYAGSRRGASIEKAINRPWTQRRLLRLTLFIGLAALANAALQTVLALSLSTSAFLVANAVVHWAAAVCLVVGLIGWLVWTGRA